VIVLQRLEEDRGGVPLAAAPGRPLVEQLGSRQADEEYRGVPRPVGQMVEEVQERRLGPLQVVKSGDDRPFLRERLEQLAHGPEDFLARRVAFGQTGHGRQMVEHDVRGRLACQ
jgi:hypothetical protein